MGWPVLKRATGFKMGQVENQVVTYILLNCQMEHAEDIIYYIYVFAWTESKMNRHYILYHSRHPGWYSSFQDILGNTYIFHDVANWKTQKVTLGYILVKPCLFLGYRVSPWQSIHITFGPLGVIWMTTPQLYPVTKEEEGFIFPGQF